MPGSKNKSIGQKTKSKKLSKKSTKNTKSKKSSKKNDDLKQTIVYDDDIDDDDDIDFNVEEETFFDSQNFKDFNEKIKFHVFDPEQYENEIRKEIIIVPNQYRKTSEVISKCEFTDVVSNRAKQIEDGSPIFVDIGDEDDPIVMAEMETRMKKCPLSVLRMISNNIAEIWAVNDMIVLY